MLLVIYGGYILVTFFAPVVRRKYQVWRYGPLPRDMIQQNFVEQRREQQRLLTSEEQASGLYASQAQGGGGGGGGGGGDEGGDPPMPADGAEAALQWALGIVPRLFRLMFEKTCPDCSEGAPHEAYYMVTLGVSFLWVTVFSSAISAIVGAWEEKLGVSTIILGITLVAVGGEVPDTIQSLAVAKKGYGSLAVANCLGAQVANIGFGLGLPWFLSALWGQQVVLAGHAEVQTLVWFHAFGISFFTFITLGLVVKPLLSGHPIEPKATLTPAKGVVLVGVYAVIVLAYIISCQMTNAMSLHLPPLGALQAIVAIVLCGGCAGLVTSIR